MMAAYLREALAEARSTGAGAARYEHLLQVAISALETWERDGGPPLAPVAAVEVCGTCGRPVPASHRGWGYCSGDCVPTPPPGTGCIGSWEGQPCPCPRHAGKECKDPCPCPLCGPEAT